MPEQFDYDDFLSKQPGRAPATVRAVQKFYRQVFEGRKPGHEAELLVATQFGVWRVAFLFHEGTDMLQICGTCGEAPPSIVFAPVEQCSFLVQHYEPKTEAERVVVGFRPIPKDAV